MAALGQTPTVDHAGPVGPAGSEDALVTVAARAGTKRERPRWTPATTATFLALILVTALFLFPVFWALNTSLQTTAEQQSLPVVWWPDDLQWSNFKAAWTYLPFTDYLWHSLIIVVSVTVGSVLSASAVAYGLSRLKYAGREFWFNVVLSTMMMPFVVTLIPQYLVFERLGWLNSYWPLVVPAFFGGGPFNIFLLRQFMRSIPREIDEAAFVDGANHWQIYSRIVMPMVKPALAVTGWMTALGAWGDFLGPLVYLSTPDKWTVGLGLYSFPISPPAGWGDQLVVGIALLVMLPVVIGFFFIQRLLVEGVNLTGVDR
ncbi:carbohydrate ABC transporter permease [Streptomyces sp. NPDC049954]|uniref:carbohydrate ABC transporter permease n=1 Tax=Streptomyces sp. NPDC049954 TaxID=3155779 RepID=UPI00343A6C83